MWGLLIALLIGIAFGYMSPGRQDKSRLFMRGLLWGVVIALIVAVLGWFFNLNPLGLADTSFFGLLISFVVLTVVFLIGVWIGDMVEGRRTGPGLRRV